MTRSSRLSRAFSAILDYKVLLILCAMVIPMSLFSPYFLTIPNLINLFSQTAIFGIMAFGMTFAIIGREFDLSVGSIMALCGVTATLLQAFLPLPLLIAAVLSLGSLIGLLNGYLVARQRLNSFIVTLGGMVLYKGVALSLSGGVPIMGTNPAYANIGSGSLLGIPIIVWLFALCLVVSQYLLSSTVFGRNLYATGGDYDVARYAGVKVVRYKQSIFVITGLTSAIAGILISSRLNTGSALHGDSAPITVIASVVIGGTSLAGGQGSALRTVVGLLILGVLDNALNLLNVYSYYQLAIKGIILVAVIGFDSYYKSR
jgi:ribose/xylose/arabinose/galactoside ABC-type transport system permease subunit